MRSYVDGLTFQQYMDQRMVRRAVERELAIISEAAVKLGERAEADLPDLPWSGVRGIGNKIRHFYDQLTDEAIWRLATDGTLQKLRDACLPLAE